MTATRSARAWITGLDLAWLLLVPAGACLLAGLALGWLLWG